MLKLRKRYLDRFYKGLQNPRKTVRRRKKNESTYIPVPKPQFAPLPAVLPGCVIAYPVEERWRLLLVMEIRKTKAFGQTAICFLWQEAFPEIPDMRIMMTKPGIPLGIVPGDAFPESFKIVGQITLNKGIPGLIGYAFPMWKDYLCVLTKRDRFYKALPPQLCLTLETVTSKITNIMNGIR